jgi:hypothetical protein
MSGFLGSRIKVRTTCFCIYKKYFFARSFTVNELASLSSLSPPLKTPTKLRRCLGSIIIDDIRSDLADPLFFQFWPPSGAFINPVARRTIGQTSQFPPKLLIWLDRIYYHTSYRCVIIKKNWGKRYSCIGTFHTARRP